MVSKDQENFLVGALVGGAVGAAAALLLTPYPGSEIRKKVRKGLNQIHGNPITAVASDHSKKPKKKTPARKAAAKHSHTPAAKQIRKPAVKRRKSQKSS
ncbi:MAG: YtxH domain-containing protein [Parachlamydia sp.]|nr:YtxH domain-containing protein [Parachlamydia sp.]